MLEDGVRLLWAAKQKHPHFLIEDEEHGSFTVIFLAKLTIRDTQQEHEDDDDNRG